MSCPDCIRLATILQRVGCGRPEVGEKRTAAAADLVACRRCSGKGAGQPLRLSQLLGAVQLPRLGQFLGAAQLSGTGQAPRSAQRSLPEIPLGRRELRP